MAEPRYPLISLSRLRMGIDGPGVTTLVAGAGCPLRCRWCINQKLLREAETETVTAQELYEQVKIDDLYFRASGGGVTFGGGESLLVRSQPTEEKASPAQSAATATRLPSD